MITIITDIVAYLYAHWIFLAIGALLFIGFYAAIAAIQDGNRKAARDEQNRH